MVILSFVKGAELIEQLRQKRMHQQEELEHKILEKIKAKMDRIKATQQKMQQPSYKTTNSHYVGKEHMRFCFYRMILNTLIIVNKIDIFYFKV